MRCVIFEAVCGQAFNETEVVVLQRVVVDRDCTVRDLYWTPTDACASAPISVQSGNLLIPQNETVELGGYFNSLFEFQWRAYTRADELALQMRIDGRALLRIWRDSPASGRTLLWEGARGPGFSQIGLRPAGANLRSAGRIFFSLTALDGPAALTDAAYVSVGQQPDRVALSVVFCTFNRERDVANCLARIAADRELVQALGEVIVVNQGRAGLLHHSDVEDAAQALGGLLRVIEQDNYGGAGGFTRGLIAALADEHATHVCYVDDDVRVEPESLYRMITFFRLARPGLALGGHMLDAIRPHILYEAGAVVHRDKWHLHPRHAGLDLRQPSSLQALTDYVPMDYNGWWMFGFPLAMTREVGLPLPCFIRGDDVEYGLRLNEAGLRTVGLPGVAVWHEPFYVKIGNWQLYYEVRNQLVAAALHLGLRRNHATTVMLKHLLVHLLTFRYFSAAMILRGINDFLLGPSVLAQDPRALHAAVVGLKARYPETTVPRVQPIEASIVSPSPRTRFGFAVAMGRILLRNAVRPTRAGAPACRVDVGDFVWFRQERAEHVAVDAYWEPELPAYARSREHFRALSAGGLRALWRLWRDGEKVATAWRQAAPRLTSEAAWNSYLRLDVTEVRTRTPAREDAD